MSLFSVLLNGCKTNIGVILKRNSKCDTLFRCTSNLVQPTFQDLPIVGKKWIARWLFGCSGMVFGAVVLGGLTRLTESGLSMTDWNLFGKLPPLTSEQWDLEFVKYKQFPEYQIKNKEMSVEEFKMIWWMEYSHRQWGRIIGAVFILPAAYFWHRGWFNRALKFRVSICGILIGFQGLLGWYMVQSGLQDRFHGPSDVPRVSQYRLMAHLGSAFLLYTLFLWNALELSFPAQKLATEVTKKACQFRALAHFTKGWVFLTVLSGALVAGLDAGLIYNSFPKFADRWIPSDLTAYTPKMWNVTENPTMVQFNHRIMGTVSLCLGTWVAVWSRRQAVPLPARVYTAALCLGAATWMQVGLGISTLLMFVPTWLASLHQSGALITVSMAIWLTQQLKHVKRVTK